jgi:hypothetical protein
MNTSEGDLNAATDEAVAVPSLFIQSSEKRPATGAVHRRAARDAPLASRLNNSCP